MNVADLSAEIDNPNFVRRGPRPLLDQVLQHGAGRIRCVNRVVLARTLEIDGEDGEKQTRR